jgi:hypothetical protein
VGSHPTLVLDGLRSLLDTPDSGVRECALEVIASASAPPSDLIPPVVGVCRAFPPASDRCRDALTTLGTAHPAELVRGLVAAHPADRGLIGPAVDVLVRVCEESSLMVDEVRASPGITAD